VWARVARWFIFRPKIPILVYFCRPWNGRYGYVYGHFGTFGIYFPTLVFLNKKNLATLERTRNCYVTSEDPNVCVLERKRKRKKERKKERKRERERERKREKREKKRDR
jgi:hypothetical protein